MESYLGERKQLRGLVIIMDIRHPLKDYDVQMLEWCEEMGTPVHVLLTKADKLKKGPASKQFLSVKKALKDEDFDVSVQMFSALKKTGLEELQKVLNEWLGVVS